MQNEKNKSAISTNDTHNATINTSDTADNISTTNIAANANNAFSKKIGRTMYTVQIFFSKTSKESFDDKLLRLIKNETAISTY